MGGKKRVRITIVAAVVLALVCGVYYVAFRGTGENSDYVNAASRLPEARREAKALFGPLTWEDYYREKGIVPHDDTKEWKAIFDSTPKAADDYYHEKNLATFSSRKLFLQNRNWFLGLKDRIAGLTASHDEHGRFSMHGYEHAAFTIALETGIIGAADAGDVRAVKELSDDAWTLLRVKSGEPDPLAQNEYMVFRSIMKTALLSAAVRHRHDKALLQTISDCLSSAPAIPPLAQVYAGEVRSFGVDIVDFRRFSISKQIKAMGESFDGPDETDETLGSRLQEKFRKLFHLQAPNNPRRIGPHTADAFEDRILEVCVRFARTSLEGRPSDWVQEILHSADEINEGHDLSFEWIAGPYFGYEAVNQARMLFEDDAVKTALALVKRFPDLQSLPATLPADLRADDPFASGDVVFRKTKTGFELYSRYINGVDDHFQPFGKTNGEDRDCAVGPSKDWADYGLVVNYAPTNPIP